MKLRTTLRGRGRPFAIWPFETGWAPAADGVTVVEMFPSRKRFPFGAPSRGLHAPCVRFAPRVAPRRATLGSGW